MLRAVTAFVRKNLKSANLKASHMHLQMTRIPNSPNILTLHS